MGNRAKQNRTIGEIARKHELGRDAALDYVDSHGWKECYQQLEAWGLVWLPNHELWIPSSTKDLWGELPQSKGSKK